MFFIGCEGLIGGESCPREVGQRTLTRIHGRERILGCEGLIDGESCPREGESARAKALPQFVKVHWRGLRN